MKSTQIRNEDPVLVKNANAILDRVERLVERLERIELAVRAAKSR